jgi:hypothetical protein
VKLRQRSEIVARRKQRVSAPDAYWSDLRTALREATGKSFRISQARIARDCSISPTSLSEFLNESRNLSGEHVWMLRVRCPHEATKEAARRLLEAAGLRSDPAADGQRPGVERWVMETPGDYSFCRWLAYAQYSNGDASADDLARALLIDLLWISSAASYFADCAIALHQRPGAIPSIDAYDCARILSWAVEVDELETERDDGSTPEHLYFPGFFMTPWPGYLLSEDEERLAWRERSLAEEESFQKLIAIVDKHLEAPDQGPTQLMLQHAWLVGHSALPGAPSIATPQDYDRELAMLKFSAHALALTYRVIRGARALLTRLSEVLSPRLSTLLHCIAAAEMAKTPQRAELFNFTRYLFFYRAEIGAFAPIGPRPSRILATLDKEFSTDPERMREIDAAWYEWVSDVSERLEETFGTAFSEASRAKRESEPDAD